MEREAEEFMESKREELTKMYKSCISKGIDPIIKVEAWTNSFYPEFVSFLELKEIKMLFENDIKVALRNKIIKMIRE